jgi:subtilisin family serine protease
LVIEGGNVIARVLQGMEWIVERGAPILSVSLGLPGYTPAFEVVLDALWTNDVLPVIAIGNEGANTSRSPGNYANTMSIGAHDEDARVASFSGSQRMMLGSGYPVPTLVAPGVGIVSCVPPASGQSGFGYAALDGTSMATPHVAGMAALLKEAVPSATASDLYAAILASCNLPSTMARARANQGTPDIVRAMAHLGVTI